MKETKYMLLEACNMKYLDAVVTEILDKMLPYLHLNSHQL